jgi:hypothetical protein
MATNIGTGPQDIPLNQFLGEQAFLDKPSKVPAFVVQLNNDNNQGGQNVIITDSASPGTIIIPTDVKYDNYGGYNTSTGEYTAPIGGLYYFAFGSNIRTNSLTAGTPVIVNQYYVNSTEYIRAYDNPTTLSWMYKNYTALIPLVAGDKVTFRSYNNGGSHYFDSDGKYTQFSGMLVSY